MAKKQSQQSRGDRGVKEKMTYQTRTADPGLPVKNTLEDVLPTELLSGGGELVIGLEATDDERALGLGEELSSIGEVLNDEEGNCAGDDRYKSFEDEDPCPILCVNKCQMFGKGRTYQAGLPPMPSMLEIAAYTGSHVSTLDTSGGKRERRRLCSTHGQETTECTRDRCRREEDSGTDTEFRPFIPAVRRMAQSASFQCHGRG